ncbi:peptidase [Phaeosphaeriaceae sp. PMI808]|nr:peptidase [Phaeosphaeriaceae sp. PMI808]
MRSFTRFIVVLLLGAQPALSLSLHQRGTKGVLPGVYIVEFSRDDVTKETFYDSLVAGGVQVKHRMDLSFRFFKGVSFQIQGTGFNSSSSKSNDWTYDIRKNKNVQGLWPVQISERKMPDITGVSASPTAPRSLLKRQTGSERSFSPHVMTQIDKLRAEGITGKGFRVAVIDSGVDYTHPALGGCFGPGCLVDVGYDFVGDNFRPGVTPAIPDGDPMDNCFGHGTHVAGTVAAQLASNKYGFTGAAPGAKLSAYRVWNCISGTTDEIQLASFARAVEDGADIISYSNGFDSGWSSHLLAVVASRITQSGIPFVISAGNNGDSGLYSTISPSTGVAVTGAGAVSNTKIPVFLSRGSYTIGSDSTINNTALNFSFLMGQPAFSRNVTLPLWSATSANNACQALPDDTPDLSNRIVLLEFPTNSRETRCYPQDQGANIAAKGGRHLLFFERINSTIRDEIYVWATGIESIARVIPFQAMQWDVLLKQGSTITLTIPNINSTTTHLEEIENNLSGGYMTTFSSWGPTWELNPKPQLAAPGENILSTFPVAMGSYKVMSGTSMSAPLVAGAYALLGEVYGKIEAGRMRRILTTTSKPLAWFNGTAISDILAPVPQQGSGLIQVWNAAHTTAELSIDNISFNDTDHFISNRSFSITNTGSADAIFKLTHRKAATVYTLGQYPAGLLVASFPSPVVQEWADLKFSTESIKVPAGASMDITVTCTPPTNLNATLLPIYSGFITLSSTDTTLNLPYLGVVGSTRSTHVLQPGSVFLANFNSPAPAGSKYTIPRPDPANPPPIDEGNPSSTPSIAMVAVLGARILYVEVLKDDKVLGNLAGWPQFSLSRGSNRAWVNGLLADGTVLNEGAYRVRVRALRVFGDENKGDDWDIITSVEFSIAYS